MKIVPTRRDLAQRIRTNVRWYNQQAKQRGQGTLSLTWIKYVAHLSKAQWNGIKRGSSQIALPTYQKTLKRIYSMETSVLGKTAHVNHQPRSSSTNKPDSMGRAKANLRKLLVNVKRSKRERPKSVHQTSMDQAKQNLNRLLGSIPNHPLNHQAKRVVTLIKAQRTKDRFNVYVNGRYAFPAGITELSRYQIRVGMPITPHLERVISQSADVSKMFTKASTRIVHHLRTELEIRKWLRKRYDCSNVAADQVVRQLKNYHLIDDRHYAQEYIRAEIVSGSKGPEAIARHLRNKGIQALTIQDELSQRYPLNKQLRVAEHQARNQFKTKRNVPFAKRLRKIKLALVRKGFNFDVASQAIDKCQFQPDQSNQKRLLAKYTRQAFRRYDRKLTPNNHYKIEMKIKRYLFRKGFQFDVINNAIEQHKQKQF